MDSLYIGDIEFDLWPTYEGQMKNIKVTALNIVNHVGATREFVHKPGLSLISVM